MEIIKAILLGIIQGITEWLPISSTGHMILADEWIQLSGGKEFVDLFMVVVQFGSILAVLVEGKKACGILGKTYLPRHGLTAGGVNSGVA